MADDLSEPAFRVRGLTKVYGTGELPKETMMTDRTYWDTFKAESENALNRIKTLVHEGNVRRVIVKQNGRTVAEFPLTAGVVGAVIAPVLAAIGALVALLQDCTIELEREREDGSRDERPHSAARGA